MSRFKTEHAVVVHRGIDERWPMAVGEVFEAASETMADKFGLGMPGRVRIEVVMSGRDTILFVDLGRRRSRIHLSVGEEADLYSDGPFRMVYGVSHEVAHVALQMHARQVAHKGIVPDALALGGEASEGWALYAGSVAADDLWDRRGRGIWPDGGDYSRDGLVRLRTWCAGLLVDQPHPDPGSACALLWIGDRWGTSEAPRVLVSALVRREQGCVRSKLVQAVRERHGEVAAQELETYWRGWGEDECAGWEPVGG